MKVIIAGDRHFSNRSYIFEGVKHAGFHITEVVSGGATGVDSMGEIYALEHGIPLKRFPANWGVYGKAAGPIRNQQMANYAEGLIAFLAPVSRGTKNMIETAKKKGLPVKVYDITKPILQQLDNQTFSSKSKQITFSDKDDIIQLRKKTKKIIKSKRKCKCR